MQARHDVVIAGGGPAGTSAAIALVRAGASVLLLDSNIHGSGLQGESLAPQVLAELHELGVSDHDLPDTVPWCGIESAWGSDVPVFHSYIVNPLGNGLHVNRHAFHDALCNAAGKAGASFLRGGKLLNARRTTTAWSVTVSAGSEIMGTTCDAIIDATGHSASVARSLGARRLKLDLLCGVSSILDRAIQEQTLFVEATPFGWWYLAPAEGRTLVCFLSDVDIIRRLRASRSEGWLKLLGCARGIASRLGELPSRVRLQASPCETGTLNRVAGTGWIAIGDAASVFDPLSSLGVMKALKTGSEATHAIAGYLGGDGGSLTSYAEQQRERFEQYLIGRHRHYSLESRWEASPFWARRVAWRRLPRRKCN